MVAQTHCGVQTQRFEFLIGYRLVSSLWGLPVHHPTPVSPLQGPPLQEPGRGMATGEVFGDLWGCFLRTRSLRTAALQSQELLDRPQACLWAPLPPKQGGTRGGAGSTGRVWHEPGDKGRGRPDL